MRSRTRSPRPVLGVVFTILVVFVAAAPASVPGSDTPPAAAASPSPSPAASCRVRHEIHDPDAFAATVLNQRQAHVDPTFVADRFADQLATGDIVVPSSLAEFAPQPLVMGAIPTPMPISPPGRSARATWWRPAIR